MQSAGPGRRARASIRIPTLTYFEMMTAAAFVHFTEQKVDVAVIEVGLGGRLDATNIVPKPLVTAITSIGIDHTEVLGDDLASIAAEKAGIVKHGVPLVVGPLPPPAFKVVRAVAADKGAELYVRGKTYRVQGKSDDFAFSFGETALRGMATGLHGDHQVDNAGVALMVAHLLPEPFRPSEDAMRRGLRMARNPGRNEWLAPDLLVDCAHNADGAAQLAAYLRQLPRDRRRTLLLGVSSDKDVRAIVAVLAPTVDRVICTRCNHPRAADPKLLAQTLVDIDVPVSSAGPIRGGASPGARRGGPGDRRRIGLPRRRRSGHPRRAVTLLALFLALDPAFAAPVDVRGDTVEVKDGIAVATGNVVLELGDEHATAERATLVIATGQLHLESGSWERGDGMLAFGEADVDLGDLTGVVLEARLTSGNSVLRADRIELTGPETFVAQSVTYTTCSCPNPTWEISARRVRVRLDRTATFVGGVIRVCGVPLVPIPLGRLALTDRKSGLMVPRLGNGEDGFLVVGAALPDARPQRRRHVRARAPDEARSPRSRRAPLGARPRGGRDPQRLLRARRD